MPLDWTREASGTIHIPDIEVTRLAVPRIPVWIGTALVGCVEARDGRLHLDLTNPSPTPAATSPSPNSSTPKTNSKPSNSISRDSLSSPS